LAVSVLRDAATLRAGAVALSPDFFWAGCRFGAGFPALFAPFPGAVVDFVVVFGAALFLRSSASDAVPRLREGAATLALDEGEAGSFGDRFAAKGGLDGLLAPAAAVRLAAARGLRTFC
jgi:hypothetical protein